MSEIPFIQLNMHKAVAASTILLQQLINNPAICLLTEPCTAFNKVTQVPASHVCLPGTTLNKRPRAVMFIPKNIPHILLENLSNPDCSVALMDTKRGKVVIASIYLDSNDDVVPDWLESVIAYVDSKGLPALLAFDCNARSQLYGPDTNERGKLFEEFILNNNLMVENKGNTSTFHAFRRGANIDSYIDVTLSKGLVPLSNWRVHESYNGSDHSTITWT